MCPGPFNHVLEFINSKYFQQPPHRRSDMDDGNMMKKEWKLDVAFPKQTSDVKDVFLKTMEKAEGLYINI